MFIGSSYCKNEGREEEGTRQYKSIHVQILLLNTLDFHGFSHFFPLYSKSEQILTFYCEEKVIREYRFIQGRTLN